DWVDDTPEVPRPVLHLITEEAVRRVAHPDFARVVSLPGFSARLSATIHEFSGAGCDSSRLAAHLPEAPLAAAFPALHRDTTLRPPAPPPPAPPAPHAPPSRPRPRVSPAFPPPGPAASRAPPRPNSPDSPPLPAPLRSPLPPSGGQASRPAARPPSLAAVPA